MKILCKSCGQWSDTHISGRKPLPHTVIEVCDALRHSSTVLAAAKQLKVSRPFIYKVLKANGMKAKEVMAK